MGALGLLAPCVSGVHSPCANGVHAPMRQSSPTSLSRRGSTLHHSTPGGPGPPAPFTRVCIHHSMQCTASSHIRHPPHILHTFCLLFADRRANPRARPWGIQAQQMGGPSGPPSHRGQSRAGQEEATRCPLMPPPAPYLSPRALPRPLPPSSHPSSRRTPLRSPPPCTSWVGRARSP